MQLNIKKLRLARDMSQNDLANKAGINVAAISHYENGRREPTLSNFIMLCKGLDCTPNELLGIGFKCSINMCKNRIKKILFK